MKNQKGITLIALVITIIVLLILAGVSISMVIGDNGIIKQANDAKTKTYAASEKEQVELAYLAAKTKILGGSVTAESLNEALSENQVDATATEPIVGKIEVVFSNGNKYTVEGELVTKVESSTESDGTTPESPVNSYAYLFNFDEESGTIRGIKESYMGEITDGSCATIQYYVSPDNPYYNYTKGYGGCILAENIDTLVVPSQINGKAVKNVEYIGALNVKKIVFESGIENIEGCYNMGDFDTYESRHEYSSVELSNKFTLESIIIPNTVKTIGDNAFYGCENIKSINIPNSVTSIGTYAFSGCKGLTNITIPSSVTSIGSGAFVGCAGLTSITIPNSVTSLGNYTFSGCTGLTNITIPSSVTSIGNGAFLGCEGITNITIPSSVTSIGRYAFSNCTGLTSITIPNSVTSIGDEIFSGCTGLTNVTIPNSVTKIGERAFYHCEGITNITIPSSVTSIGSAAFAGCTGLINVTIPSSVTSIGGYAFSSCTGINQIWIPKSVTTMGDRVFFGWTANQTINCEASSKPAGWNSNWDKYDNQTTARKAKLNWGVTK